MAAASLLGRDLLVAVLAISGIRVSWYSFTQSIFVALAQSISLAFDHSSCSLFISVGPIGVCACVCPTTFSSQQFLESIDLKTGSTNEDDIEVDFDSYFDKSIEEMNQARSEDDEITVFSQLDSSQPDMVSSTSRADEVAASVDSDSESDSVQLTDRPDSLSGNHDTSSQVHHSFQFLNSS
jgi:hypothetical protein